MTTLGLISDIHANPAPLSEALAIFQQQNVDMILCPGDIAGYGDALDETVRLLIDSQCQSVRGNHENWYLQQQHDNNSATYNYINALPASLELTLQGQAIFMVHAQPPADCMGGIRLLDKHGELDDTLVKKWTTELADFEHDVLIVGHTHQVFAEQLARTLVINPGSCSYNHSCAILTLPGLTVDFYSLSNQQILKSWNWGTNQLSQDSQNNH